MYRFLPKCLWPWTTSKRDSRFFLWPIFLEIRSVSYFILSLRQQPLKVSNKTTACTLCIDPNLQRHRAVSLRQYGVLVLEMVRFAAVEMEYCFVCARTFRRVIVLLFLLLSDSFKKPAEHNHGYSDGACQTSCGSSRAKIYAFNHC